jgi:hypothetical protein
MSHLWALLRPFAAKAPALIALIGQEAEGFSIVSFRKFKGKTQICTQNGLF